MTMPATDMAPPPLKPPAPQAALASLEAVELELALGHKELGDAQFEAVVRETVETIGGILLFRMELAADNASRWVAAVAFGEADDRDIAIIDLPRDGGRPRVLPASDCELPVARIAQAYAGLAECWGKAA